MFFCLYKGIELFETDYPQKKHLTLALVYIMISGYYDKQYLIYRKYCRFTRFLPMPDDR